MYEQLISKVYEILYPEGKKHEFCPRSHNCFDCLWSKKVEYFTGGEICLGGNLSLQDLIEQALQDGTIYPELVGKDKLQSLIIEK